MLECASRFNVGSWKGHLPCTTMGCEGAPVSYQMPACCVSSLSLGWHPKAASCLLKRRPPSLRASRTRPGRGSRARWLWQCIVPDRIGESSARWWNLSESYVMLDNRHSTCEAIARTPGHVQAVEDTLLIHQTAIAAHLRSRPTISICR